ncbi:MAG: hypothetical protein LIP06_10975 [Tannerellaceae bacterium]|nr:hypothetical protein [Tannerellaceae bacterium]
MNKELLRKINRAESRRAMYVPFVYEIFSLLVGVGFMVWIGSSLPRLSEDFLLLVCGLVAIGCFLTGTIAGLIQIRQLSGMNYADTPVIRLQKQLAAYEKTYRTIKKISYVLMPVLLVSLLPTVNLLINGTHMFDRPIYFSIVLVAGGGIGISLALWIYKKGYEEKILLANQYLKELEEFETEG